MQEELRSLLFAKRIERVFIHSYLHIEEVIVSLFRGFNKNEGRLR
jgi:hypothetical protein